MCCTLHDASATLLSVRAEPAIITWGLASPVTNPSPDSANQLHLAGGAQPST